MRSTAIALIGALLASTAATQSSARLLLIKRLAQAPDKAEIEAVQRIGFDGIGVGSAALDTALELTSRSRLRVVVNGAEQHSLSAEDTRLEHIDWSQLGGQWREKHGGGELIVALPALGEERARSLIEALRRGWKEVDALRPKTGFVSLRIPVGDQTQRAVIWVPENYDAKKKWPMIVFLHGRNEGGNDGRRQLSEGLPREIRAHPERFPCLVLIPQCPRGFFWTRVPHPSFGRIEGAPQHIDASLDYALANYSVDAKRVALTGLSMGGIGAFVYGADHADRFCAIAPVAGGGDPDQADKLATTPMWILHGANDRTVPTQFAREMHEAIQAAKGEVKYTEYAGVSHNSWGRAYSDPKVIEFLIADRTKGAKRDTKRDE